ncbi:growth arrest-specific protein 2 [Elysia marginata]|uniref:Growth arrest-specific protein 2 n=1 Tax=Elysia marginata TaxID=1093978 RepID=A0AAV4J6C7_9GAST|nr:growth arrest-specific protein 2 [Elysia marginata]
MPLPFRSLTPSVSNPNTSPRALSKEVANAPKKEPLDFIDGRSSLDQANGGDEVDHISQRLSELQGELFLSLKEDIAEWIIKTLVHANETLKAYISKLGFIDAENFVHALDTGVILCRLSLAIEEKAREAKRQGIIKEDLPDYKLHCNKNAKSGTWFARDNTTNFLKWCRAFGMIDETLFDSEDLGK